MLWGLGEVRANTRAAATASAYELNSPTGVTCPNISPNAFNMFIGGNGHTFPGLSIVPPMTTTSFTRRKVSGSWAAANARFVKGPTATIVTVFSSFSFRTRRISSAAGCLDGMNDW